MRGFDAFTSAGNQTQPGGSLHCFPMAGLPFIPFAALAFAFGGEALAAEPPVAPRREPSKITQALVERLPRFVPPAPAAASREEDQASDGILRLPKITVRPSPFAPESDFALLNAKGRLELALKTHPGIQAGNILGTNEALAHAMQREEWLAAEKTNLADRVQRSTLGDSAADKKIRALTKALFQRSATDRAFPERGIPRDQDRATGR